MTTQFILSLPVLGRLYRWFLGRRMLRRILEAGPPPTYKPLKGRPIRGPQYESESERARRLV